MAKLTIKFKQYVKLHFTDGSWGFEYEKPEKEPLLKFVHELCTKESAEQNKTCDKFMTYERVFQQAEDDNGYFKQAYTKELSIKEFLIKNLENFEIEPVEEEISMEL